MLKWLRRYSRSWFIALAIGAIVIVFIFWGVGTMKSPAFQEAAEVNGAPILMTAYQRQYQDLIREYQERSKGELTEELAKMLRLKEMALNRLIDQTLILQAAGRLGLTVTDAELRQHIQSYPFFQQNGRFDEKRYYWVLSRSHLGPQEFEKQERQRLLIQKVIDEVGSFAKVSDLEMQEFWRLGKEEAEVNFLVIPPERFVAQQQPSPEEVSRFYQENQAEFRVPPRVRVNYLLFRPKDFEDRVSLTQAEVDDYLSAHAEEFDRPKLIRASQILLPVSPKASPAERQQALQQAQELLKRARAGEDFAQLAKVYSQDAASKDKGGDLGEVKRGQNSPEWDKVAFTLKPGEVGQAITPTGIYLIRVAEIKETERLPDADAKVRQRLKAEKARSLAKETAEKARGELAGSSMAAVAKKYGVTPQETPLFGQRDPVPGIGVHPGFSKAALELKPQAISPVVDLPEGFGVLQGVEQQAEHLPPLDQIKDQVRAALQKQLAGKQAEKEAARLLAELRQGKPLAQVAAAAGLNVQDSGFFTRQQGFQSKRQAEALTSAAFQLSAANPYPGAPLLFGDNYYLLAFKARKEPDAGEFAKEQDQFKTQFLEQKRQLIFSSWLEGERRQAKIKVYELP